MLIKQQQGFTLIELLTVVAITMSLAALILPTYGNLQSSTIIQSARDQVIQNIRLAKNLSCTGKNNSNHGVFLEIGQSEYDRLIIFSGDSYASRIEELDEEIVFEKNVIISNTFLNNQILFFKNSCLPDQTGIINIASKTISHDISLSVNSLGIISE